MRPPEAPLVVSHKRGVDTDAVSGFRICASAKVVCPHRWIAGAIGQSLQPRRSCRPDRLGGNRKSHLPWRVAVLAGTKPEGSAQRERVMKKRRLGIVLLGGGLVAGPRPPGVPRAQETRGKITGRVTDTTKAVIPGATVTVTDVATRHDGSRRPPTSRACSRSTTCSPAPTRSRSSSTGFKKHVQENVIVQISETRNLTVVLEVGGVQEAVSVTAETAAVNTSDANLGLVVDQERLASLPLIHGDPYKIMGLATGLTHTGDQRLDRPFEPTHIIGYAKDGTRGNRSDLLIDGVPSTATANANEVIATYVPPSDLVQEFRVQTATFDAQFGNTEGGVTSMSIKSGTNTLPRDRPTTSPNRRAWARTTTSGRREARRKIESNSNRPGFTIGGPRFAAEGQDVLHVRLRANHRQAPALRHRGHVVGADRGAAQRRLLGVLVVHHDLRSADPRRGASDVRRTAVPRQRHPGEPDQPDREEDPRSTTACPRTPARMRPRARPATSPTRPWPSRRRPTTRSPAASTRRSPTTTRCSGASAGTSATATTTTTSARWPRAPCSSSSRGRPSSTTCTCSTRRPS